MDARRIADGREEKVPAASLRKGDVVVVEAGQIIPGDGEVVEGVASVDESAITGESAPVIRGVGRRPLAPSPAAPSVLSDRILVRITANPGESFLDRMIGLVEGASRQKTPNEIALHILLVGLTLIFLFACVTLVPLAAYSGIQLSVTAVVALLVCLIPTTIGGLLSAIGIAGMDRLLRKNVLAMSGRAVEAAGDVDTLLLDKTGTITLGNRMATELHPGDGRARRGPRRGGAAGQPGRRDPGGALHRGPGQGALRAAGPGARRERRTFVPFTAQTRMSGCDLGERVDPQGCGRRGGAPRGHPGRRRCRPTWRPHRGASATRAARRSPSPTAVACSASSS